MAFGRETVEGRLHGVCDLVVAPADDGIVLAASGPYLDQSIGSHSSTVIFAGSGHVGIPPGTRPKGGPNTSGMTLMRNNRSIPSALPRVVLERERSASRECQRIQRGRSGPACVGRVGRNRAGLRIGSGCAPTMAGRPHSRHRGSRMRIPLPRSIASAWSDRLRWHRHVPTGDRHRGSRVGSGGTMRRPGSPSPRSAPPRGQENGMSGGIWPPEWLPTTRNGPCSGSRSNPFTSERKYVRTVEYRSDGSKECGITDRTDPSTCASPLSSIPELCTTASDRG